MSEKNALRSLLGFGWLFVVVSGYLLIEMNNTFAELDSAQHMRYQATLLSDELRQSSDDLTRMVRLYAVTGDARYRQYFQDILDIRNGTAARPADYQLNYWDFVLAEGARPAETGTAVALQTLYSEAGLTDAELALLAEAEAQSNSLAQIENEAIAMVERLSEASGGNYMAAGDEGQTILNLLHGDEYHAAKAEIMRPLAQFHQEIEQRTNEELVALNERFATRQYLPIAAIVIFLVILTTIVWQQGAVKLRSGS